MKTYSVKEISKILDTNPETVRRWIRSDKLKVEWSSRKYGNVVYEDELYKFLKSSSKYVGVTAGMAVANPILGLGIALRGMLGVGIASVLSKKDKSISDGAKIDTIDLNHILEENIQTSEKTIENKKKSISQLQAEINTEEKNS